MAIPIQKKPEWSFYAAWIILTFLSVPIAFILNLVILRVIISVVGQFIYVNGVRHITEDYLFIYPFVPIVGIVTGIVQYGLLRRYLAHMGWWVFATLGGWLLGMLLIAISTWLGWTDVSIYLDTVFIVMGLSIGAVQWVLLRRRLPHAGWWIGANVVGWGLVALSTAGNSIGQFGLFILGFVPACVTAAMLALLINQVQPTEPKRV
jgi:peptidoglycan/LPS O-acetylase OafA/YrhL